jgi:hypothetical protein
MLYSMSRNRAFRIILLWAGLVFLLSGTHSAADEFAESVRGRILAARYMSMGAVCSNSPVDILGFPQQYLQYCHYQVSDSSGQRKKKDGFVYLANAEPEKVLAWIDSACQSARVALNTCRPETLTHILEASGAQFVVAGIVWEDLYTFRGGKCLEGRDGIFERFAFRMGVTVVVKGHRNCSIEELTEDVQRDIMLKQPLIRAATGKARISSTLPDEYQAVFGLASGPSNADVQSSEARRARVAAQQWLDVVHRDYLAALGTDSNRLVTAWVCVRFKREKTCRENLGG